MTTKTIDAETGLSNTGFRITVDPAINVRMKNKVINEANVLSKDEEKTDNINKKTQP